MSCIKYVRNLGESPKGGIYHICNQGAFNNNVNFLFWTINIKNRLIDLKKSPLQFFIDLSPSNTSTFILRYALLIVKIAFENGYSPAQESDWWNKQRQIILF